MTSPKGGRQPVSASSIGQRHTAQREAIVGVIRRARGPLTIREIHDRARRAIGSLGIATVYRNVKLLTEAREVQAVVLPDGETRYEPAGLSHHHHFHCRRCGRVFDLEGCQVAVPDGATLPGGFVVEEHELTLYGKCPDCAGRRSGTKRRRSKGGGRRSR